MATGKIIWFNDFKGYGFIEDQKGNRYIAHTSALKSKTKKTLKAGDKVKFTATDSSTMDASNVAGLAKSIEIL